MARPKVDDMTGTRVSVTFTSEVGAVLVAKARREGRAISELVRQAVGELVVAREAVEHPHPQLDLEHERHPSPEHMI